MARSLSPERIQLKEQAIVLRKMGWTQQAIADQIGVPQPTLNRWFIHNALPSIADKRGRNIHNAKAKKVNKTAFLSWCGKLEDFQPEGDILFDLIIADPPWNISDPGHKRERKVRPRPFTKDFGPWDTFKTERAYLAKCRQWLKKQKAGWNALNAGLEMKLRAERRLGELLEEQAREPGDTDKTIISHDVILSPKLSELSVSLMQSHRWQRLFHIPEEHLVRYIAEAIGRSQATVSGYLSDLRARHELAQDLKMFKMGLLGIPQERIAQRLGISQFVVHDHLLKNSELKEVRNSDYGK